MKKEFTDTEIENIIEKKIAAGFTATADPQADWMSWAEYNREERLK